MKICHDEGKPVSTWWFILTNRNSLSHFTRDTFSSLSYDPSSSVWWIIASASNWEPGKFDNVTWFSSSESSSVTSPLQFSDGKIEIWDCILHPLGYSLVSQLFYSNSKVANVIWKKNRNDTSKKQNKWNSSNSCNTVSLKEHQLWLLS